MPRQKGTGKGQTDRFNIRLDEETAQFYKTKANEHGISISEFLRQTLIQGVISENVYEIEQRLKNVISELSENKQNNKKAHISDEMLLSIFTSEEILSDIVEARDTQKLYAAQDKAKLRLQRLNGMQNGKT